MCGRGWASESNRFDVGDPKMKQWLDPSMGWTKQIEGLLESFHDSLTIYQGNYYRPPLVVTIASTHSAVPKEVGKVGTESPAIIQPITERKDGIRAMFAKQQKGSPSPSKLSTPTSEQAQHETQPQSEPQSSGQSHISSEFPTTPVGKRKVSALEDSGVSKPQGSPTKKPRLGSASPRKGGLSPTVSLCLSHASLTLLLTVARNRRVDKHRASPISLQGKPFHSYPASIRLRDSIHIPCSVRISVSHRLRMYP